MVVLLYNTNFITTPIIIKNNTTQIKIDDITVGKITSVFRIN